MITLKRAKTHLEAWLDAELAISTAQSYSMGSRTLTRANLPEVRKQIDYWRNQVSQLEMQASGKRMRRTKQFVPIDN